MVYHPHVPHGAAVFLYPNAPRALLLLSALSLPSVRRTPRQSINFFNPNSKIKECPRFRLQTRGDSRKLPDFSNPFEEVSGCNNAAGKQWCRGSVASGGPRKLQKNQTLIRRFKNTVDLEFRVPQTLIHTVSSTTIRTAVIVQYRLRPCFAHTSASPQPSTPTACVVVVSSVPSGRTPGRTPHVPVSFIRRVVFYYLRVEATMMATRPSLEGAPAQSREEPISVAQEEKNMPGVRGRERERGRKEG